MDPIELASASEIARSFHKEFVARWPEFANHASLSAGGDLRFEIPRGTPEKPLGAAPLVVMADVDSDETIISFGGGHSHGGGWRTAEDPDFEFQASIRYVEEILAENVLGYSTENGGGGMGFADDLGFREDIDRIQSWRGTYDWER